MLCWMIRKRAVMGIFKELTQALKNDPWIPFSKKGSKPSAKAAAPPRPESKGKGFCGPGSAQPCITVCVPRAGCTCECEAIREGLLAEIQQQGLQVVVGKAKMGCSGTCANGPFIGFPQRGFFYLRVQTQDIPDIVHETLEKGNILFPLLSTNPDHSYRSDVYFERDTGFLGVMDEKTSMVQVAKYFLDFEEGLSCGKCTPCRVGIKRLNESMERIVSGQGTTEDLRTVKMLCETLRDAPHCDFAAASSKPVLSAVTFFENEFLAIVKEVPPAPEPVKESAGEKKNRKLDEEQAKTAERAKRVGQEKIEILQVEEAVLPEAVPEAPAEAVVAAAVVTEPAAEAPLPEPAPEAAADLVEEAVAAPQPVEAVEAVEVPEPVEAEPEAKAEEPIAAAVPAAEEGMPSEEAAAEPVQEMTALVEEAVGEPEGPLQQEEAPQEQPAPEEMQAEPVVDIEAPSVVEEISAEVQEATEEPAAGAIVGDAPPVSPAELIETAGTEETGPVEAEAAVESEPAAEVVEEPPPALEVAAVEAEEKIEAIAAVVEVAEVEEEKQAEAAATETVAEPGEGVESEGLGRDAGLEVEIAPSFAPPQETVPEMVVETGEAAPAEEGEAQVEKQEGKTKKTGGSKAKGAKAKSDKEKTSGKKKKKGSSGGKK